MRMQFPSARQLLAAVLLAWLAPVAGASQLVVIVSASNPVGALRADQVADIFLAQAGHFPDGADAVALDQGLGSPLRNEFYTKVTARSPALVRAY
jgi:ABC-type phosphate transport system substrate-binding protein